MKIFLEVSILLCLLFMAAHAQIDTPRDYQQAQVFVDEAPQDCNGQNDDWECRRCKPDMTLTQDGGCLCKFCVKGDKTVEQNRDLRGIYCFKDDT